MMKVNYKILVLIIIIFLFFASVELFLPSFIEKQIINEAQNHFLSYDRLQVNLSSRPSFLIFLGVVENLDFYGEKLEFENMVEFKSLRASASNIRINLFTLIFDRMLSIDRLDNEEFQIVIRERAISDYFLKQVPEIDDFILNIKEDKSSVSFVYEPDSNFELEVEMTGRFVLDDDDTYMAEINYIIDEVKLQNISLPDVAVKGIVEEINLSIGFHDLPLPLKFKNIETISKHVVIDALYAP